jgi:hypothetical protein
MGKIDPDRLETEAHRATQNYTARLIEKFWNCKVYTYPGLHPIDWYAVRDGKLVANMEFKRRHQDYDDYINAGPDKRIKTPTMLLSYHKWLSLYMAAIASRVPGFFVAGLNDCLVYINVFDVRPHELRIDPRGGRTRDKRRDNDIEPVIHVPITDMKYQGVSKENADE